MSRRRGRPALAPGLIVEAALGILDTDGLEALSMRRVAAALGVENPALYWHFRSKQALLDLMAQTVLEDGFRRMGEPPAATWDAKLGWLARGFRRGLLQRRDGAKLIASADLGAGNALQGRIKALSEELERAGFDPTSSIAAVVTAIHYTLGATFEEQAEPASTRTRPWLSKRFELGVEIILDGLRARAASGSIPRKR